MSEATTLDTDAVYVRPLEEGVVVWRPASAYRLGGDVLELSHAPMPHDEIWEFAPGSRVVVRTRHGGPHDYPVAAAIAEAGAVLAPASFG